MSVKKGGIGLRGPGETQLETDRRLLRARIKSIESRLNSVRKQREQGRRARTRAEVPTVSFVGYTNAGKSTLFNGLTQADVYAEDQLFATLDPTMRRIELNTLGSVVLADTVGFISHLPHRLVEAFRATLEEANHATLLLHIIDSAAEERQHTIDQVQTVLQEIGADTIPQLKVYNKIDLLDQREPRIEYDDQGRPKAVWLSAQTGAGLDLLLQAMTECLQERSVEGCLSLPPHRARLRALLHDLSAVEREVFTDDGSSELSIKLAYHKFMRLLSVESLDPKDLHWLGVSPDLSPIE